MWMTYFVGVFLQFYICEYFNLVYTAGWLFTGISFLITVAQFIQTSECVKCQEKKGLYKYF